MRPFLAALIVLLLRERVAAPSALAEPPAGWVPLASAPPQRTELRLPFTGVWGVIQGMNSGETHSGYAAYALDFAPAEALSGQRFRPRRKLEDFPCFGRPILAPADGVVVWVADGARDWPPGRPPPRHEAGNFVIIQHAEGEYTEMRHLKRDSIPVQVGQRVRRGELVGRCGNSGDATTPHLHLGLLGSYDPIATRPMRLSGYQVLGPGARWLTGDGTPRTGQLVRSR